MRVNSGRPDTLNLQPLGRLVPQRQKPINQQQPAYRASVVISSPFGKGYATISTVIVRPLMVCCWAGQAANWHLSKYQCGQVRSTRPDPCPQELSTRKFRRYHPISPSTPALVITSPRKCNTRWGIPQHLFHRPGLDGPLVVLAATRSHCPAASSSPPESTFRETAPDHKGLQEIELFNPIVTVWASVADNAAFVTGVSLQPGQTG
jgi:hypothetical protein